MRDLQKEEIISKNEYQRQWRLDNPEKIKEYKTRYKSNNKEKIKAQAKIYRNKNKDRIIQLQKEYWEKWPEKAKTTRKRWRKNNPEKMRSNHLKREYNISLEGYNKILQDQENKCAICNIHKDDLGGGRVNLDVDHCHETGKIRGLLCPNCNKALGLLKDNINIVQKMTEYLIINT